MKEGIGRAVSLYGPMVTALRRCRSHYRLWITVPPNSGNEMRNSSRMYHRVKLRESAQEIQSAISKGCGNPDTIVSPGGQGFRKLMGRSVPPGQGGCRQRHRRHQLATPDSR